jgi:hypothetical protein
MQSSKTTGPTAISVVPAVLRALSIVRGQRAGKMVFYSLEDDHVRSLLAMVLGHQGEQVTGPDAGL